MMIRSEKRAMLPRVSRKHEHKNIVLHKLLIRQSHKRKNHRLVHAPLQSSRDNIKKKTLYILGSSYRAEKTIKTLGCPLGNKIWVMSSSFRNIKPRRAPGVSRRIEHVSPRKRKNQKSSKPEFRRLWPHVISCRLAPGGAHPHPEFKSEPGPYNPGRGRQYRDNRLEKEKINFIGLGDLAAKTPSNKQRKHAARGTW